MNGAKVLSIVMVGLLGGVFFLAAASSGMTSLNLGLKKEYTGDKEVFDEKKAPDTDDPTADAKGKPSKPPVPEPDPTVDKWAVVIGISDYRGKQNDLRYCDDDAQDMYNYLIDMKYPAGNIKLLKDSKASASAIMAAIDWMNSYEGSGSECVFFYSGHGSTYDGYNDGDTEYTDEAIVSTDLYLILDGQLKSRFSGFSSQKIAFIFDSCFSGGMDDLKGTGRVVVAACGEEELSYDGTSDLKNGVFTYYFMEDLTVNDKVESAFNYAYDEAPPFVLSNYDDIMTPTMYDEYTGDWTF